MEKQTIAWLILAVLTAAMPLRAEVHATLSQSSSAQNEPVTLTLESDGAAAGPPDLSTLEQDFHIVHRSTSRSSRSFNGRRSQRTTVTLRLIPKRGGELTIPAIDFGQERSQPLQLSVTPVADAGPDPGYPPPQGMGPMEPAPFPFAFPQPGFTPGFPPPFPAPQDWGGMQGMPDWNAPGFGMPEWTAKPEPEGWKAQPDEVAPAEPKETEASYWPWITGLLLAGWIITSALLWRRTRRVPRAPAASAPAAPVPNQRQLAAEALDGVRRAYENSDAGAAKAALLHWAAIHWPADPPTNLSRLAARCPSTVQRHILKLDESLYSPEPTPWSDQPVWEQLGDLERDELEPAQPAAGLAHSKL